MKVKTPRAGLESTGYKAPCLLRLKTDQQTQGDCWQARTGLERSGELGERIQVPGECPRKQTKGNVLKNTKQKAIGNTSESVKELPRSSSQRAFPSYR